MHATWITWIQICLINSKMAKYYSIFVRMLFNIRFEGEYLKLSIFALPTIWLRLQRYSLRQRISKQDPALPIFDSDTCQVRLGDLSCLGGRYCSTVMLIIHADDLDHNLISEWAIRHWCLEQRYNSWGHSTHEANTSRIPCLVCTIWSRTISCSLTVKPCLGGQDIKLIVRKDVSFKPRDDICTKGRRHFQMPLKLTFSRPCERHFNVTNGH